MEKVPVGVLGATGTVGQRFIQLLQGHPWFQIVGLGASERSAGKKYKDIVDWKFSGDIPSEVGGIDIELCEPKGRLGACRLVFSALDAAVAGEVEEKFAQAGIAVFTNAKNHRMAPDVPMVIPLANPEHLEMIPFQQKKRNYNKGFIVTNSNCSTAGLVVALKALQLKFGLEKVFVVTMQALSGAGYPGVPSLDILDNVIPYISGEEEKMEAEPIKILGEVVKEGSGDGETLKFQPASLQVSAQCNRVHVLDGHTESVSVQLKEKPKDLEQVKEVFLTYTSEAQKYNLPSYPKHNIVLREQQNRPQPRLDRDVGGGYSVVVGRVRKCPLLDLKFTLLSHNTVIGAAGSAILNAELCKVKGFL
eukprot:TRINITY_DN4007_c0_g1_i1.p1 TRINITY_DN4007_c0_g1~~TRINITY_DN4007_c0_g1_i1.p1  ORF type:complete len:383 (-),score=87.03 TRINITY_DN4007_c0_g1_i1:25-1110(-)